MSHYYHLLIYVLTKKRSTSRVRRRNVSCITSDLLKFRDFSLLSSGSLAQKKESKIFLGEKTAYHNFGLMLHHTLQVLLYVRDSLV